MRDPSGVFGVTRSNRSCGLSGLIFSSFGLNLFLNYLLQDALDAIHINFSLVLKSDAVLVFKA